MYAGEARRFRAVYNRAALMNLPFFFWKDDRGLVALLLCLVATLFVGPPLMLAGIVGPLFFDVFFGLVLVSGVAALSRRRSATVLAGLVAGVALATRVATFFSPSIYVERASMWLGGLSLLLLTILTLAQVFRSGPITFGRIAGSIAAYLLIGFAWSFAYELLLSHDPVALRFPEETGRRLAVVYFSFVTLTTVGYGDITPVAPIARSLAACEALVGQLFPAILIARLVSMEIAGREGRRQESEIPSKR